MTLDTIGSIAIYINGLIDLPDGVSGNLVQTVDIERLNVQNYTGKTIGSNSISEIYQGIITNLALADVIDIISADDSDSVKLAELSVTKGNSQLSSKQLRDQAIRSLSYIGKKVKFGKTLV